MPGFQSEVYLMRGAQDEAARPEPPSTILGFGTSAPPAYEGP